MAEGAPRISTRGQRPPRSERTVTPQANWGNLRVRADGTSRETWYAALVLRLVVPLLLALHAPVPAAAQAEGRGLKLLHMQGCTGCHSLDGRDGVGPSLAGRLGGEARVVEAGVARTRPFDAAYVAESLRAPDDAVARGYPSGVMPAYALSDEQLAAVLAALAALPPAPAPSPWLPYGAVLALVAVGWWRRRATRAR
jgi:mono/diheme cytochrome c family protein